MPKLAPLLVEVLVDPVDRSPLWYIDDESSLYNPQRRVKYVIADNDIPILLSDEAQPVDEEVHKSYVARFESGMLQQTGLTTRDVQGQKTPQNMTKDDVT